MSMLPHFEIVGEGRQTIVICNGLSQSTANWRGLARQNPKYRWLLFDARGHGRSPLGDTPYDLDKHVGDLLRVLHEAGGETPLLMGFSHGGRVALRAAAEFGTRFCGLVVVSCAARVTVRRRAHVASWEQCLKLGGVGAMAWASLPNIVGRKILERYPDLSLLVKGSIARNREAGLSAMFEGMAGYPPIEEDARRIELPTLILRGEEDPLVAAADERDLCRWISGARAACFDGCGHTLPLEEPVLFMQAVSGFLNALNGSH